jgi:hypothetical protein
MKQSLSDSSRREDTADVAQRRIRRSMCIVVAAQNAPLETCLHVAAVVIGKRAKCEFGECGVCIRRVKVFFIYLGLPSEGVSSHLGWRGRLCYCGKSMPHPFGVARQSMLLW